MTKKNLILGGILIVLVVAAYLYQGPLKDWRAKMGKEKNFLAQIDVKSIDKIEVGQGDKITTLEKQGDPSSTLQLNSGQVRWKIGGTKDFYVIQSIAGNLTSALEEAVKADFELVSASKDKKSEFKTDDSGVKVKLFQGGDLKADFIIGKIGNDYRSTYISKADMDKTFLVAANLFSAFNQSDWRDRTIFSSDKEKITKVRFQYPGREFYIEKKDGIWQAGAPYYYQLSEEKVNKVLEIMSNLTASWIPEQNFAGTGLEKHSIIMQATGDGVDNTLMIGNADKDENYYAKRGDSDNIYLITRSQGDELNKKIQELR